MNVLYLTINPNRASTTVPTEGWFRLLPAMGLRPVLVSRELGSLDAWSKSQQIPTYQNLLPFPDKRRPWQFMRALWHLRTIAKRHRIDLVHCNEQDVYPIGQYLARLLNVPVVVSVHFTMERGFCQWAFGGKKMPNRMFFVSGRCRDACRDGLDDFVPKSRQQILHNGLDLSRYQVDLNSRNEFRNKHKLDDCVALGVACALRERKQIEHLFAATQNIPDRNIRVLLAGGAVPGEPEGYADELVNFGKKLLGDRFVYLGHLDDLRPLMNGLDLFINTSREESFGIAALEAMACGCPVVGYDSKAVDEVVLPDGGEITPQDDIPGLQAAITRWLNDPVRLAESRQGARRQAERFDIEVLSHQLWYEYGQVLQEQKGMKPARETASV